MINWKKRGAKLLGSFFNGYGGGFVVALPSNYLLQPEQIQWDLIFLLPLLAGLAMTWPQLAKVFNEIGDS